MIRPLDTSTSSTNAINSTFQEQEQEQEQEQQYCWDDDDALAGWLPAGRVMISL
jgi:hypothetical protein